MRFSFTENGKPLNEQEVQQLEVELGYNLPAGYKTFLRAHNGCRPKPDSIKFDRIETDIAWFLGFGLSPDSINILWNAELHYSIDEGIEIVPIAADSGGGTFCLVVSEALDKGVVYLEYSLVDYVVHDVAESFEKFLDMIGRE
jgi:SMI1-KNR4 cell-wall